MSSEHEPAAPRSPALAALLSFVWPGLGQAYSGDRRGAVLQAVPPAIVVAAVALLALLLTPAVFAAYLLNPPYAALAGLLILGLAGWRIASILHARRVATPGRARAGGPSTALAVLLVALVVVTHGWAGSVVWSLYQAGVKIGQPITTPSPSAPPTGNPTSSPLPTGTGTTPTPGSPSPPPSTPQPQGRVTILFLGADLGRGVEGRLTDTIQVASFDPRTGRIVMISLPRDTGQLPLYNGGRWDQKVNALMTYAEDHPDEFPDGGLGTLRRELEFIIGIPIHYYAAVDFTGFQRLVDMVGGVDVVLERPINDATYSFEGRRVGFQMAPGEHHLDGRTALAYVRSRHGPGNSDFQRARRQQQVILALRHKINEPQVLANLPAIIGAASEMVRTDAPLDRLPEIVALLQASTAADTETYVLQPRRYAEVIPRTEIGRVYMTRLKMDAVAELSIELFGEESRYAQLDD